MKIVPFIKENKWLLLILTLAAFLRFYRVDFQSIWLDEVLTMNNTDPSLSFLEFYKGILFWEYIPHLYFFLVRVLFEIFGYTTLVARVFSAVIGVVGVYSMYLLGKELFDKKAGLISAIFLTVNIFHISYSQEIRPYGMLFLFTVLAFYRMVILIKEPILKNAVYYGIFAGLILNSHFFGFITLFSQYLILLFFLLKKKKEDKKKFFNKIFISGIVTLIVFSPVYEAFVRVSEIESFWLQKPNQDAITRLFGEFFGYSELVLFMVQFLVIYYVIELFKEKEQKLNFHNLISNKLIFSFIILIFWLGVSIIIPLLRSHLDVPMILSRYFINILPAIVLVIAIGLYMIKNTLIKKSVMITFTLFSLIDLFVISKYYHTVRKTQFREITTELLSKNENNDKIVSKWAWLFNYYFKSKTQKSTTEASLEMYVQDMINGKVDNGSFWYIDANQRPYSISPDLENYLNENFIIKENLEYFDTWAKYYVAKNQNNSFLNLNNFKPSLFDGSGAMIFVENMTSIYPIFNLEKGLYTITINGVSLPAESLNNENAHFKFLINGKMIKDFYLDNNPSNKGVSFTYEHEENSDVKVALEFDNDAFINGIDRNAIINSVKIEKSD